MVSLHDNALITLAEIKEWLKLSGSGDDDFLQGAINDWSDTIEKRFGRIIKSANYTDERHPGGKRSVLLKNFPVSAVSSITVDDDELDSGDYAVDMDSGIIKLKNGLNFDGGPGGILISYTGGYDTVPGDLKRSVKQIVALEFYLSGHGRKALSRRSEGTGEGSVTYERGPDDQEKIMGKLVRKYARR